MVYFEKYDKYWIKSANENAVFCNLCVCAKIYNNLQT